MSSSGASGAKKRKIKAQRKEEEIKMQRRLASFFKPTVSKSTTF